MKLNNRIIDLVLCLTILASVGMAQDEPGCKDHPLLSRMPNFIIQSCETKDFDSHVFSTSDENEVTIEGAKYYLSYIIKEGSQPPSDLQILRNFSNAVQKIGGSVLYTNPNNAYLKVTRESKEVWIHVRTWNDGEGYDLTIVEKKLMQQDITANDMLDALNSKGFVALYILFDTNLAVIKPESQSIVEQIAKMLTDSPELKVSIEGHTDNTGTPQGNKALSLKRAEALVASLVKIGIDPKRLSAVGWGQEKPVADNRSEEGKAKNRRVEIVKK